MEQGIVIRPFAPDEVPLAASLLTAYERETLGESLTDVADVAASWRAPEADLARDTRLALRDGEPAGLAQVHANGVAVAVVLREHQGHGLGTALADFVEQRLLERGVPRVEQEVAAHDEAALAMLRERGYLRAYESWVLELPGGATIGSRALPPRVRIRPMAEGEERAVHRVVEDAFGEWEGRRPRSFESWRAHVLERDGFDREQLLVAVRSGGPGEGDDVLGVCVVMDADQPDEVWVAQLAVRRQHRGQGLAQQLLAEAYAAGRARGRTRGRLATDSRTGALSLYERLGMRIALAFRTYRLRLASDG